MTGLDPLVPVLVAIGLLTGLLSGGALREHSTPGGTAFAALTLGVTVWVLGYANGLLSGPAGRDPWIAVQWLGVVTIPVAWLVFALQYTCNDRWVTPGTVAALSLEPAAMVVLLSTTSHHGLLSVGPGTTVWSAVQGPAFVYHLVYTYALLLLGTAVLVQLLRTTPQVYGATATALVVGIGVPWGANVAYWLGLTPPRVDPTALGFAVSAIPFGWVVFERRAFEVLPLTPGVAREELVDAMSDGVVAVDAAGRVVDCNRAAAELLASRDADGRQSGGFGRSGVPALPGADGPVGAELDAVLPPPVAEAIATGIREDDPTTEEVLLDDGDGRRYFEVRVEPLHRQTDRPMGALVTFHDIHDRVLREQRLNVLNRVLRHNVRHQANLVLGNAERIRNGLSGDEPDLAVALDRAAELETAARRLDRWSNQAREIETMLDADDAARSRVDLVAVVEEVVAEIRRDHPEAEVTTHLPSRATATAHESLADAITELLENAIRHNDDRPHAGVEVEATGDGVELSVVDDGPGIPEEERKVLDHEAETDLDHGSGLGLWLVNWAVRASGGELALEEACCRGSHVRIDLPGTGEA